MIPYDPKIWHGSFARPSRLLQLNNLVFLHELHSVVLPVLRLLEGSNVRPVMGPVDQLLVGDCLKSQNHLRRGVLRI
jgi:hypothetical protein